MPRFTHYFDVRIAQHFESDIEDFDKAFDDWIAVIPFGRRKQTLTSTDESLKTLCQGIIHSETTCNDP